MPLRHLVIPLAWVLFAALAIGQEPDKRRDAATYVFLGTVVPGEIKGAPGEAVLVTVNEIYLQAGKFESQVGRQVEVTGATAKLQQKARYVFYTEPVQFGQRITVQLIDVAEPPTTAAAAQPAGRLKQDLSEAYVRREIAERAALAPLIVLGTVTDIRPLPRERAGESEHDPQFQLARLKVERTLKGKPATAEVEFVFAASKDVQWYRAPKFRLSSRGVFLLQRPEEPVARLGIAAQRFTVLHPLDFRQPADMALVEAVVKGGRQ